jgi:hypothetical protein
MFVLLVLHAFVYPCASRKKAPVFGRGLELIIVYCLLTIPKLDFGELSRVEASATLFDEFDIEHVG